MIRRVSLALLLACAGCQVAQPTAVKQDDAYAELREPLPLVIDDQPVRLAVANVWTTYRDPEATLFPSGETPEEEAAAPLPQAQGPPEDGAEDAPAEADAPSAGVTWSEAEPDPQLQKRLRELLAWSLYGDTVQDVDELLPRLTPGELAPGARELEDDALRTKTDRRRAALCRAADDHRAELVLHVELLENRAKWLHRDGFWWWGNLFGIWGLGAVPVLLIPDEWYEVELSARLSVHHARSGQRLFSATYRASESRALNDLQRGFNPLGLFGLYELFLQPDDLDLAHQELYPHARERLLAELVKGVRENLPPLLKKPRIRSLLREGEAGHERTWLIALGPGKQTRDRPARDAQTIARAFRESGSVESPEHLRLHFGPEATRARVAATLAELGPRVLGLDRLVFYFAGQGSQRSQGPALELSDGPLPLADLAKWVGDSLSHAPSVVFILDTSFATGWGPGAKRAPGRTAASAAGSLPAATYLRELGNKERRWCVLAAAGPDESAYEIASPHEESNHGLFSYVLLQGLRHAADADGDARLNARELLEYTRERVDMSARAIARGAQRPWLVGAEDVPIARVGSRTETK